MMKAAIFKGKGKVEVGEWPDPVMKEPTDATIVGYVGVPHGVELPLRPIFGQNIGVHGGGAPVRAYLPELMEDVLTGRINPGRVFDFETDLDGVADAYAAMDARRAIKSLVRVSNV